MTGDLEQALNYSYKTLRQYKNLTSPLANEGLENFIEQAKNRIDLIKQWNAYPIICCPKQVSLIVNKKSKNQTFIRTVIINALAANPDRVFSDNPFVEVKFKDNGWTPKDTLKCDIAVTRVVVLQIRVTEERDQNAIITVQDSLKQHILAHIPVHIRNNNLVEKE